MTQADAQAHLDSLKKLGDAKNQRIYWCRTGGHWHIGDRTKKKDWKKVKNGR